MVNHPNRSKSKGPTAEQLKALLMASRGDKPCLYRQSGGFWIGSGADFHLDGTPKEYVDIQTVRACEKRGWLVRSDRAAEWCDERNLTDAGRALIGA